MEKRTYWADASYQPGQALQGSESASVLIVGAGVVGLFAAHFLHELGFEHIVIIDKNEAGSGSSGHSAGMLVGEEIETASWPILVEQYGMEIATMYLQAHFQTQQEVLRLIAEESIECDLIEHDLTLLDSATKERTLKEAALRKALGSHFALFENWEASQAATHDTFAACAFIEKGASVNPLKFFHGVANVLRGKGVRIYEHTPLLQIDGSAAKTPEGSVVFDKILYSRGVVEKDPTLHAYLTSVCVTAPLFPDQVRYLEEARKEMFLSALLNESETYHYGTTTKDKRLVVGFGDAETQTEEAAATLDMSHVESVDEFIEHFLGSKVPIEYAWTSPYSLSKTSLPFVSQADNRYCIAGAGTQITSVLLASYIAQILSGRSHPLSALFAAS